MKTDLLRTDIRTLGSKHREKRFDKPASAMTLDVIPDEWRQLLSREHSTEEWDQIIAAARICTPAVWRAVHEACAGRDSLSRKTEAYRQWCAEYLTS